MKDQTKAPVLCSHIFMDRMVKFAEVLTVFTSKARDAAPSTRSRLILENNPEIPTALPRVRTMVSLNIAGITNRYHLQRSLSSLRYRSRWCHESLLIPLMTLHIGGFVSSQAQ